MKDQARLMGDNSWREGTAADLDGTKETKKSENTFYSMLEDYDNLYAPFSSYGWNWKRKYEN
jgi:hypothetical protein